MEQANCSLEAVSSGLICTIFISTDTLYQSSLHNCMCVYVCAEILQPQGPEGRQSRRNKPQQVYGYRQSHLFR